MKLEILPQALNRLKNPPKELNFIGDASLLELPKVAVVGSRKASIYTKECVAALCSALKSANVCVISGGAIGVDIAAHKAAMPRTIGVFASGLDIIYPAQNKAAIKEIYEKGLALSEYEEGEPPLAYRFLERNRIVVGLCEALVVAQADLRSGSMQSARLANELNIPVYVLPQRINESSGTNSLLASKKAELIDDYVKFASLFGEIKEQKTDDDIVKFCKDGVSLDEALSKFGEIIYEYELDGLVEISNLRVKSVL
jgi:hypothetical protein